MIQTKQNQLYDFENQTFHIPKEKAVALQKEIVEQNLGLIQEAIMNNCNLIFTTEAINFAGRNTDLDCKYEELVPELSDILFERIAVLAQEGNVYIVVGAYNKRKVINSWNLYNSAIVFSPSGEIIQVYDKIHLAGTEKEYLTAGNEYVTFDIQDVQIGISICWDLQFPEFARELMLRKVDLIICLTWGWEQIYGHARAYENGIYVSSAMGVPYKGSIRGLRNPSEVISPKGDVMVSGGRTKEEIIYCDFHPETSSEFRNRWIQDRRPDTYNSISR